MVSNKKFELFKNNKNAIYVQGEGENAILGLGSKNKAEVPEQVFGQKVDNKIKKVVAGNNHSMVLLENGDIFVWGRGFQG